MPTRNYIKAIQDFKDARRQAALEVLMARITGKSKEIQLLPYHEVREKLRGMEKSGARLQDIPLEAIVGSVGRYHEFTRSFLPKQSSSQRRWAKVMAETLGLSGLPPIEVYQIGDAYFVKDGNHRVSVARQLGNPTIEAYVTQVKTRVPLKPDTKPDDLIIKAEYVQFLEQTSLDRLRPESDFTATKPGAYPALLEHIEIHRYYMGLNQERHIPYQEAVEHWFDHVYQPVTRIIKEQGILRDFPRRTETDLYLWLADHRADLERELGWEVGLEAAATDLATRQSPTLKHEITRLRDRVLTLITPEVLEEGPPPGTWRETRGRSTAQNQLFRDILVAIDHSTRKDHAVRQAAILARADHSRLHGMHIHPSQDTLDEQHRIKVKEVFLDICREERVDDYDFTLATGEVVDAICDRARFADLLALPLNHPPGEKRLQRLGSGLRSIIRRCPRPILTVPGPARHIRRVMLAYDGSPKAKEALYVAAYITDRWSCQLSVVTSRDGLSQPHAVLEEAQTYLQQRAVGASFLLTEQDIASAVKDQVRDREIDLILIGGYGAASLIEVVLGSSVDRILREVPCPALICR